MSVLKKRPSPATISVWHSVSYIMQSATSSAKIFFVSITMSMAFLCTAYLTWAENVAFDHNTAASHVDCKMCHTNSAASTTMLMPNAGSWCVSCHASESANVHPIGIAALASCGLPLEGGLIGCLTCHSPHKASLASMPFIAADLKKSANSFSTYLLNVPNASGELCNRCHENMTDVAVHRPRAFEMRRYAGSPSCAACHEAIYRSWSLTPHARMTRKPGDVPDLPALSEKDLELPPDKIKYVLGSHYVYRFVAEATGTLVVLPRILDRASKKWLPILDYGWTKRRWLEQCAGCHTTGFSENGTFVEPGIGCEACHGPALDHARSGAVELVINPAKIAPERAEMICMSCHTSGVDSTGKFCFPLGYKPGEDLTRYFSGLTPKPGQDASNFAGDESLEDRRRQWKFLQSRLFLAKGLTCDYCQNFRDFKPASGGEYLSHDEYCLTCHYEGCPKHAEQTRGSACTTCHVPLKTASGSYDIHDHKFRF